MNATLKTRLLHLLTAALVIGSTTLAHAAATITIVNLDSAGEGFNDPTVVVPIGGNTGTTRGAQRLQVFQQAAAIWGAVLTSPVPIRVEARFDPIGGCTATSGVLGSAGPLTASSNFPGAELPNTWYHIALASKLAGSDLAAGVNDISARFNTNVDNATCLGTSNWYYGFDHNHGTNVDLLAVVLHELGHGLGFSSLTNSATGALFNGQRDIWAHYLLDTDLDLHWDEMTDAERVASAINTGKLVWDGPAVIVHGDEFLGPQSFMRIDAPAGIAGEKEFGTASFGTPLGNPALSGDVVLADDGIAPNADICSDVINGAQLSGKIALIDRGTCPFVDKVLRAQIAGAIGVIIINNVVGSPPLMGGDDPGLSIPAVSITLDDGNAIKTALLSGTVTATFGLDVTRIAGQNGNDRTLMYAPNPLESGSSVSHFDVSAEPDLLMEPAITPNLTSSVDLTRYLFEDIGWFSPRAVSVEHQPARSLRLRSSPNPFFGATTVRFALAGPGLAEVDVHDLNGRLVKRLLRAWQPGGEGAVTWDGTDANGRRVSPGVYLARVRSGGTSENQRIVRIH